MRFTVRQKALQINATCPAEAKLDPEEFEIITEQLDLMVRLLVSVTETEDTVSSLNEDGEREYEEAVIDTAAAALENLLGSLIAAQERFDAAKEGETQP